MVPIIESTKTLDANSTDPQAASKPEGLTIQAHDDPHEECGKSHGERENENENNDERRALYLI